MRILLWALFGLIFSGVSADAGGKVALVIGIETYQHISRLKNPVADATAAAAVFRSLDFETVEVMDADRASLSKAIADFHLASDGADLALIYYAGHGVQIEGKNYLLTVDSEAKDAETLFATSVPMEDLINAFAPTAKARFMVVDACRDNPFEKSRGLLDGARGLARGSYPANDMLIFFSAQPNETALDGAGNNSPFLMAFQDVLTRSASIRLNDAVIDISAQVRTETRGRQIPYVEGSLTQHLNLVRADVSRTAGAASPHPCNGTVATLEFPTRLTEEFVDLGNAAQRLLIGTQIELCADAERVYVNGPFAESFDCADVTDPVTQGAGYYFTDTEGKPSHLWLFVNTAVTPRQLELGLYHEAQEIYWMTTGWPFCQ